MALIGLALFGSALFNSARGEDESETTRLSTGSRATYVHRITLYDHEGRSIRLSDATPHPYSPAKTCGKCHDVDKIGRGWHFNAPDSGTEPGPGRPGEPWLLVDEETGTQIPISSRSWPGTYRPETLGLSGWRFTKTFGRHFPGGGLGQPNRGPDKSKPAQDPGARWQVSGQLEIDCMICHSANLAYDPAERARQIERENFKWAPTAALGLAAVSGSAKDLPEPDPLDILDPAYEGPKGLPMTFDRSRFDAAERVLFNITRRPSAANCYYCHTTRQVGPAAPARWQTDMDVHLTGGMTCTDCHRSGIDHMIVRGYEGEPRLSQDADGAPAARSTPSCRDCHLPDPGRGAAAPGGRTSAPIPRHNGLPPFHLERMTCTACHSGPWPQQRVRAVQTSLAHRLGLTSHDRRDDELPHIVEPVFIRQAHDNRIAPHRMLWPAFWGRMKDDKVHPIPPEVVKKIALKHLSPASSSGVFSDEQIAATLKALVSKSSTGEAVYVRQGKIYRRASDGSLSAEEHPAAKPYTWALAHDVRPAARSLGVRGCNDCHASDAPMYFGELAGPWDQAKALPVQTMAELRGESEVLTKAWSLSFAGRTAFKIFIFSAGFILALVMLHYGNRGLAALLKKLAGRS